MNGGADLRIISELGLGHTHGEEEEGVDDSVHLRRKLFRWQVCAGLGHRDLQR